MCAASKVKANSCSGAMACNQPPFLQTEPPANFEPGMTPHGPNAQLQGKAELCCEQAGEARNAAAFRSGYGGDCQTRILQLKTEMQTLSLIHI